MAPRYSPARSFWQNTRKGSDTASHVDTRDHPTRDAVVLSPARVDGQLVRYARQIRGRQWTQKAAWRVAPLDLGKFDRATKASNEFQRREAGNPLLSLPNASIMGDTCCAGGPKARRFHWHRNPANVGLNSTFRSADGAPSSDPSGYNEHVRRGDELAV